MNTPVRVAATGVVAVALVAASLVLPVTTAFAAEEAPPAAPAEPRVKVEFPRELRYHGLLAGLPKKNHAVQVAAVDEARRQLHAMYMDGFGPTGILFLNTYDLSVPGNPPLLRSRKVSGADGTFGGDREAYSTTYDRKRQLLYFASSGNTGAQIDRLDVKNAKGLEPWNLSAELPGFNSAGLTYAPQDNRLYLIGEMSGGPVPAHLSGEVGVTRGAPVVAALDANTGKLLWARVIAECQQPMVTYVVGSMIVRSELRDSLYFFCHSGGNSALGGIVWRSRYPGQSALLRLNIDPAAGHAEAASFTTDVFPVSGSYKDGQNTGVAAFDPATDRVIVQSRAPKTPGAWVFDGRLDAWVGFITAPDANNRFIAVNPRTGRHYMGGHQEDGGPIENAYMNIADARLSPVPQGQTLPFEQGAGLGEGGIARIAMDPLSQRLFPNRIGDDYQIAVIEDTTPVQSVDEELNFDALTSDGPITETTLVQYSGGTNGYGANVRLAGGAAAGSSGVPGLLGETLRTYFGLGGSPPCASLGVDDVSCVSGGDRQFTIGSVPAVDLRNSGASAQATALELDSNTDAERDGARRAVRNRTDGEDDGASSALNPVFGRVDCLDGGGDRQSRTTPDKPLGTASVTCDLAKNTVEATSAFGDVAGEAVAISSSTFDTRSALAPNQRSITESTADARGIRIGPKSGTHVTIGAVETVAATVAGGRPGTTLARWQRTLSGVRVQDGQGKETFASPGCSTLIEAVGGKKATVTETGNCNDLIKQLNTALKGRAELRLPQPEITATPKGAFAAINKTQRDFLQASTLQNDDRKAMPGLEAIVFNDGEEKSRLVVQLAGVQANSIFLISNFAVSGPWGGGEPVPTGPAEKSGQDAGGAGLRAGAGTRGGSTGLRRGAGGGAASVVDGAAPAPAGDGLADVPAVAGGTGAFADALAAPLPERLAAGLRWLARSPGEAVLVGAMWLLFTAALIATVRRCLLLRQLQV